MTTPGNESTIATSDDVRIALREQELDANQIEQLDVQIIPALSEIVESYLGYMYGIRTVSEDLEVINGRVYPTASPVRGVTRVERMDGTAVDTYGLAGDSIIVPTENAMSWLEVTMTAGHTSVPPMLKHFVVNAAARTIAVDPQVAIGVLSSYSVEGTSITYSSGVTSGDPDTPGGYSVGELSALDRLRKLTFL